MTLAIADFEELNVSMKKSLWTSRGTSITATGDDL